MSKTVVHSVRRLFVVAATAAAMAACGDEDPVGPDLRDADLKSCQNLQVPAGSALASHFYAKGAQIYRWSGSTWTFVEPSAVLFSDAQKRDAVGIHYGGPTWLGTSGGKVVAAVVERCTADPTAIPWLLLGATSTDGAGVFQQTKFIQRLNTVGGNAPTAPGTVTGELASVPYTAEYLFYRAR